MHLLVFLHLEDRFLMPERIDEIISAELPSEIGDPTGDLRNIIGSSMVHGPCRPNYSHSSCMINSSSTRPFCSKRFPKSFQDSTIVQEDGYPLYQR